MASITDQSVVQAIIAGDGVYPGDENGPMGRVVRIIKYRTNDNRDAWALVYEAEANRGELFAQDAPSQYVHFPVVIWRHKDWLEDGDAVIVTFDAATGRSPLDDWLKD